MKSTASASARGARTRLFSCIAGTPCPSNTRQMACWRTRSHAARAQVVEGVDDDRCKEAVLDSLVISQHAPTTIEGSALHLDVGKPQC
jgi:hypothetical protein